MGNIRIEMTSLRVGSRIVVRHMEQGDNGWEYWEDHCCMRTGKTYDEIRSYVDDRERKSHEGELNE